jgi:peroxiredoxin
MFHLYSGHIPINILEFTLTLLTDKPAVSFTLADSDGQVHHLEDYRGTWLLMVFHRHLG